MQPRMVLNPLDPGHTSWADGAHCREAIRTGSRSFHMASLLLPSATRWSAHAMYAFCRDADDVIDEADDPELAIAQMYRRLDLIYAGTPGDNPADRAFADIVARFAIPRCVPDALLEGFCWDTMGRTYETMSDVIDYAVRVASTVGLMMTLVMDRRDRNVLARAADLGIAMQITNIVRDIGEDARNGRLYMPRQMMRDVGLDPEEWLANPRDCAEVRQVAATMLAIADQYYDRARAGVAALPSGCRSAIRAAGLIYAAIGREVKRNGFNSVDHRAVTSRRHKIALLVRAMTGRGVRSAEASAQLAQPCAPQVSLLLDAVQNLSTASDAAATLKPLWHYDDWGRDLFGLLIRVEQRKLVRQTG